MYQFNLEYYFEAVSEGEAEAFFDDLVEAILAYTAAHGQHCAGEAIHRRVDPAALERELAAALRAD